MTTKESIKWLEAIREKYIHGGDECMDEKRNEAIDLAITALKDLEVCRNELCLYCGQYKQRHLGACDGCRWYMPPKEDKT